MAAIRLIVRERTSASTPACSSRGSVTMPSGWLAIRVDQ